MNGGLERLRSVRVDDVRRALTRNRQFVAGLIVLLLAVAFFPGSPARPLLSGLDGGAPADVAGPLAPEPTSGNTVEPGVIDGVTTLPPVAPDAGPQSFPAPPPQAPPAPKPPCSTDAVADLVDTLRGPLTEALGAPAPGQSIRDLAAIAAGCSDADPSGPVLNLALEFAAVVPDLGLPPIDLPDLPGIPPIDLPPSVVEALGPVADQVRDGCGTLSLLAVVLAVAPPAANLPFTGSDLAQFVAPISTFCSLFDEAP